MEQHLVAVVTVRLVVVILIHQVLQCKITQYLMHRLVLQEVLVVEVSAAECLLVACHQEVLVAVIQLLLAEVVLVMAVGKSKYVVL